MVDYIKREKGTYYSLWDEVPIIDKDHHWQEWKLKEAVYIGLLNKLHK